MVTLGNPAPLGLLCFGMTTLTLMYVEMEWVEPDFNVNVAALAVALGGFGQILVGIFEIIKGSSFSFAVFECYGAFWLTWAILYIEKSNMNSTFGDAVHQRGSALYLAQWGILSSCFWVVTWRKNIALITIFFLLSTTFFILSIATETGSANCKKVGGYFGFATAVAAFYTGVAELINEEYGRHILPGLAPIHLPQRVAITPQAIRQLINYDERNNTLWLQFRGLQIRTLDDVEGIREGVYSAIQAAISTPGAKKYGYKKVHVVADYDETFISDDVAFEYWDMASTLEREYYLSATRFHVSSFGTQRHYDAVGRRATAGFLGRKSGDATPLDGSLHGPTLAKSLMASMATESRDAKEVPNLFTESTTPPSEQPLQGGSNDTEQPLSGGPN